MKTIASLSLMVALTLTGCARFTTTQTDVREGKNEKTTITTKVTATTFFDSRSALTAFKAAQTEKSQGASVGALTQDAAATNVNQIVEAVVKGAIEGAVKSVTSTP